MDYEYGAFIEKKFGMVMAFCVSQVLMHQLWVSCRCNLDCFPGKLYAKMNAFQLRH